MKLKILLGLVVIFAVFGCKDSFENFNPDQVDPSNPIDPFNPIEVSFNASVFVEVLDTDGQPVEDAGITLGTESLSTNEFGIAYLDDVRMGTFTYLTVDKVGYFHGSRMFYPTEGKVHYVKVTLLPQVLAGTVDAASGGRIDVDGGVVLDFPANGVQRADGTPYSGDVNVFAHSIPADDPELHDRMPGDLLGLNIDGNRVALASFGMVAVELESPSGEELQVATGSAVEMRMDVPADMLANAPASIPMWSFDEQQGVWIEEGTGELQNNSYVAQLPHFSFWNCDFPYPLVKWGASFVFESGAPVTQLQVCVVVPNLEVSICAYTNEDGTVCGLIPKDEEITIIVNDPCGNEIYSDVVGPYSDTAMIGPITLPEISLTLTTVSGTAVDCDDNPVEEGYVRISSGNRNYYTSVQEDGSWELEFINCNQTDVIVTVIDQANLLQSTPLTFAFAANIDAGEITTCDEIAEFVTIEVADSTVTWLFPFYIYDQGSGSNQIQAYDSTGLGGGERYFFLQWDGDGVGTFPGQVAEIGLEVDPGIILFSVGDVEVQVTAFGNIGELTKGTFSGTMEGTDQSGQVVDTYEYTGSFSVLRQ